MKCGWWNRWWHRRLREADVLCLLPVIAQKAAEKGGDVDARIDDAFALHASLPGQEHWRCECATLESALAADAVDPQAAVSGKLSTRD